MRTQRPTTGQASTEYIATIALIAVVMVLAAPVVGAPSIASAVVKQMERALCVVGLDICDAQMARDAGLAPCPLGSEMSGHEASATWRFIELGGRNTITVTPNSDGTVSVVRAVSASGGVGAGGPLGVSAGPLAFGLSADGTARTRVQYARGWDFPDQATAGRFLEHALRNSFSTDDWPPTWQSAEDAREVTIAGGLSVGGEGFSERGDVFTVAASGSAALGLKSTTAGVFTVYGRVALDRPEYALPFEPSKGFGRAEGVVEVSFDRDAPREVAVRVNRATAMGDRLSETVMRLDLRDAENLAFARSLLRVPYPWPGQMRDDFARLLARMASHGTIERIESAVEDDSGGVSGSLGKLVGGGYKRIKVSRSLVSASARAGGFERRRLDCQVASK